MASRFLRTGLVPLRAAQPARLLPRARVLPPRSATSCPRRLASTAPPTPGASSPASSAPVTSPSAASPAPAAAAALAASVGETGPLSLLRVTLWLTSIGLSAFAVYLYATDTRAGVHRWVVPRLMRVVFPDAEDAHHAGTEALRVLYQLGLNPRDRTEGAHDGLGLTVFGGRHALANPIGISAGLDKDAAIPDALFDLGAAVVEVGGCTPRPQAGNARPRLFRVPSVDGLVNRYGLNSIGADALAARLRARVVAFAQAHGLHADDVLAGAADVPVGSLRPGRLLLVQIAKNKDTDEHDVAAVAEDYAYCVRRLAPYADVLVVNVSSPNTPGLRDLQAVEPLTRILGAVVAEARRSATAPTVAAAAAGGRRQRPPPQVMVKVSPDEDADAQIDGICEAVYASGVDGIIVGNTTKRRSDLVPGRLQLPAAERQALAETGGFSGPAMFGRTRALVARYRQRLDARALAEADGGDKAPVHKTLFASGGVTTGAQALQLLNAGASVAMLYTGMVYGGAGTVTRIKGEMREQIRGESV